MEQLYQTRFGKLGHNLRLDTIFLVDFCWKPYILSGNLVQKICAWELLLRVWIMWRAVPSARLEGRTVPSARLEGSFVRAVTYINLCRRVVAEGLSHVKNCPLCQARGFICEGCYIYFCAGELLLRVWVMWRAVPSARLEGSFVKAAIRIQSSSLSRFVFIH